MEFLDLPLARVAQGVVRLPGSKSISNRILLLAALAEGVTQVRDLLASDDTARMLDALMALGVPIIHNGNNDYQVQGVGGKFPPCFPVNEADLFLGNAGTAFRPLTAVLALAQGHYRLFGVPRMHERPIGDLVDALRQLGADITYLGNEGFPPLEIKPASIRVSTVTVKGDVSSQFLTGLLLALPLSAPVASRVPTIAVAGKLISQPYVALTIALMARFGVPVECEEQQRFTLRGGQCYRSPGEIFVEGDASSASYFLAAGAIGGGPVRVEGVGRGSPQGDVRFIEALEKMGARITLGDNWIEACAPQSGHLQAIDLDCNHIPDAAMTLAVTALFAAGVTTLRNIASWRVKETDRLAAVAQELRKLGAEVEEGPDFLRITPPHEHLTAHAAIDTYDDHRMAMCFSLAAFGGAGVRINDPGCVAKTFPEYFKMFANVTQSIPVIAIDGPSASGKGTVAQRVAQALGYHYLDSGALYRLLALAACMRKVSLDDEATLAALAMKVDIRFEGADIWLDGNKVGDELRTEQSGAAASKVAALPAVRLAESLDVFAKFGGGQGEFGDGRGHPIVQADLFAAQPTDQTGIVIAGHCVGNPFIHRSHYQAQNVDVARAEVHQIPKKYEFAAGGVLQARRKLVPQTAQQLDQFLITSMHGTDDIERAGFIGAAAPERIPANLGSLYFPSREETEDPAEALILYRALVEVAKNEG